MHRVLTRYHLARLAHLDRATGRVIHRYEHAAPSNLVHVGIKKLGNIPDGDGYRVHGRAKGNRNNTTSPDLEHPRRAPQGNDVTNIVRDIAITARFVCTRFHSRS